MRTKTQKIIRGIGSLIEIFPRPKFSRYITHKDSNDRMAEHWHHVGDSFRRVIIDFEHNPTNGPATIDE